jgi:hypothetical protein
MQTIEERLDQLEKRNRRLTAALAVLTVAMCAMVTMAATDLDQYGKMGVFDTVVAKRLWIQNDAGQIVIALVKAEGGNGMLMTMSAKGKELVTLGATVGGEGAVTTYQSNGKRVVTLGATVGGEGTVTTYQPNGKELVDLGASDNGGLVYVWNKTGEGIVQMKADEYGNGVVWAGNRKGMGRTLEPGP